MVDTSLPDVGGFAQLLECGDNQASKLSRSHLAGFELQVIASLATRVTAFHAASPRSKAKLSVIPLSLSRK